MLAGGLRRVMFALLGFLLISYSVLVGVVMMILASIQEATQDRPELETRWNMAGWSLPKLAGASALIALPSLLVLIPLGLIFVV